MSAHEGFDEKELAAAASKLARGDIEAAVASIIGIIVSIVSGHGLLGGLAEGGTEHLIALLKGKSASATKRLVEAYNSDKTKAEKARSARETRDELVTALGGFLEPKFEELRKENQESFLQTVKLLARVLDALDAEPTPTPSIRQGELVPADTLDAIWDVLVVGGLVHEPSVDKLLSSVRPSITLAIGSRRGPADVLWTCLRRLNETDSADPFVAFLTAARELTTSFPGITKVLDGAIALLKGQSPRLALRAIHNRLMFREQEAHVDSRTRRFVGRSFLFDEIERTIRDPDAFPSGYIRVEGPPGIGKTAFAGRLARSQRALAHFNRASGNVRRASDFLGSLCAQLIVRFDLPYAALREGALDRNDFLCDLLEHVTGSARGAQRLLVVIDALDEALDEPGAVGANRLLLPSHLPHGAFFVVTTRPGLAPLSVERTKTVAIRSDDPKNKADIETYVREYLAEFHRAFEAKLGDWGTTPERFAREVAERSEGNFMYVSQVMPELRSGSLEVSGVDELPEGLRDYYERHWLAMQESARVSQHDFAIDEKVIGHLAVALAPLSIDDLAVLGEVDASSARRTLERWRPLLEELTRKPREPRKYRLYHESFAEFLEDRLGLERYRAAQDLLP